MKVSVITPTYKRYRLLYRVLDDVARQECPFEVEHVVVADGPDRRTEWCVKDFPNVLYRPLPAHVGRWGCAARQHGLACSSGEWVVFWDDDNLFYPDALAKLLADPPAEADMIFGRIWYCTHGEGKKLIPRTCGGAPKINDVDTAAPAVRRAFALRADWRRHHGPPGPMTKRQLMAWYNHDWRWINELVGLGARITWREEAAVGIHLGFLDGDGDRSN